MPLESSMPGGAASPSVVQLLNASRETGGDDQSLFGLFSAMAKEAGREDLVAEFRRRAEGLPAFPEESPSRPPTRPQSPPTPTRPQPSDAWVNRHREACKRVNAGDLEGALPLFRDAIALEPHVADAHCNIGVALARLQRLPEAEASFRFALRLDPVNGTAYVNLTTCLLQQSKFPEAEELARQTVHLRPDLGEGHRLLGCALESLKKYEPAEKAFQAAVRLLPNHEEARSRHGGVLARLKKWGEAEAAFLETTRINPQSTAAWTSLASVLNEQGKHAEGVDALRQALRLEPASADIHNTLGVALASQEKFADAELEYRQALRLNPNSSSVHNNLGNTLRSLGRLTQAEQSLREALRLRPNYPEAHNNLGIVHVQNGKDEEGLRSYNEALRLAPEYPEAHLNKSLTLLGNGDFANGWPEYEWRWKVNPSRHSIPDGPRWDGTPLGGRRLLITVEQGLGDTIHFIRYAALAKERGGTTILNCPPVLATLAKTCPGIDDVRPLGGGVVTYDTHIPLLSLPAIFGVPPEAATSPVPYLAAAPERVEHWKTELAHVKGLRVGIAWQGSKIHKGDRLRSVALQQFKTLQMPGVSLVSIQKGPGTEQLTDGSAEGMDVLDVGRLTDADMADTAAVMENLDLVVAVDTAVVHLAGALGRAVWVALPFASDWRWLRNRDDSPWYPKLRLFRQSEPGDWDAVFRRMGEALGELTRTGSRER